MIIKDKLTKEEFLFVIKQLWEKVDEGNTKLELFLQIAEIDENNEVIDMLIESSHCIVCQSDLLVAFIERQNLQHCDGGEDEKVH